MRQMCFIPSKQREKKFTHYTGTQSLKYKPKLHQEVTVMLEMTLKGWMMMMEPHLQTRQLMQS